MSEKTFDKLPFPTGAPGFHKDRGVPYFLFESHAEDNLINSNDWTPEERAIVAAVAAHHYGLVDGTIEDYEVWQDAYHAATAEISRAKRATKKGDPK
jgi:hypothetical protein